MLVLLIGEDENGLSIRKYKRHFCR